MIEAILDSYDERINVDFSWASVMVTDDARTGMTLGTTPACDAARTRALVADLAARLALLTRRRLNG